jgi:PKD repeat protein
MTKHAHGKIALLLLIMGSILILVGCLPSFGVKLELVQETQHNVYEVVYLAKDPVFREIHASISTNAYVTPPSYLCCVADWIGVTAVSPSGDTEFIQTGSYVWKTADGVNGNINAPTVFWATKGPVDDTNYQPKNVAAISVGTTHSYRISFDGTGWSVYYDNSEIKRIVFPYPANMVWLTQETICNLPNDPGLINHGVVTFSNAYAQVNSISHPYLSVPTSRTIASKGPIDNRFFMELDGGNIGMSLDAPDTLKIGWGLPQVYYLDSPFNEITPPPPTPLVASALATPISGPAPLTVQFTGSAWGGSPPYSYSWSFQDGSYSNQQNPVHTYQSAGSYWPTFTVTDSAGQTKSCFPTFIYVLSASSPTPTPTPNTIIASASSGGSISPSGSVSVNYGSTQTFTITADTDYSISSVIVDGSNQGVISSYTFIDVKTAHSISAAFVQIYKPPNKPPTPWLPSWFTLPSWLTGFPLVYLMVCSGAGLIGLSVIAMVASTRKHA